MHKVEDLVWKNKSKERFRYLMLFGIRFVEVFMASVIPSFIGLYLVFLNPTTKIMYVLNCVSFVIFCVANWIFWMRYARQRANRLEFYIVNGIIYALYMGISVVVFNFSGQLLYSILFSNLRALECVGLYTSQSLIWSHIIVIVLMIICEIFSRYYHKEAVERLMEDSADPIEMDIWGAREPVKNDKNVTFLSAEEVESEMERDRLDAISALDEIARESHDNIWNIELVKGRGGVAKRVFDDTESDTETENQFENYTAESLWDNSMCKSNNADVSDAENADDERPTFESDNEELWSKDMHQGTDKDNIITEKKIDFDETKALDYDEYDVDAIWSSKMHQGRKNKEK